MTTLEVDFTNIFARRFGSNKLFLATGKQIWQTSLANGVKKTPKSEKISMKLSRSEKFFTGEIDPRSHSQPIIQKWLL